MNRLAPSCFCRASLIRATALAVTLCTLGCQREGPLDSRQGAEFWFRDPKVVALVKAAQRGNVEEIDRLVAAGADVNAIGEYKMTPLYQALVAENKAGFSALLRHGASPNALTQVGRVEIAVMHLAATKQDSSWLSESLKHGGDPNLQSKNRKGVRGAPIHYAIYMSVGEAVRDPNPENVRLLLAAGADINADGNGIDRPLVGSLAKQHYETVYVLVENGADQSKTPIQEYELVDYMGHMHDGLEVLQPDQVHWFWKVIDLLNERGAKIDKSMLEEPTKKANN